MSVVSTMSYSSVVSSVEYFKLKNQEYDEVTLVDAYDSFTYNIVQELLKLLDPVRVFRSKSILNI